MKLIHILTLGIFALSLGCNKLTSSAPTTASSPKEKCPIHNVELLEGNGKLLDGMTVSWIKEIYDAMEKYPYVRHNTWASKTVKYCEECEKEIDRVIDQDRKNSQPVK